MKAAILSKYSKNNLDLDITEVSTPQIKENQILVKVIAAGINPLDNMITRGEVKIITPYKLPLIAGNEMVGIVEKVGINTRKFNIGDRVFARLPIYSIGAFAEYVSVDENALALVPDYLSDEEAASIPLTSLTILQSFELMKVEKGKTLFVSGGTGAVGSMAIPIAKAKGLKVIVSGNESNKERVLNLGVDEFIDYKKDDYTKKLADIDYVLDTLGGKETEKQFSILKKGGKLVSLKGLPDGNFAKKFGLPLWKQLLFKMVGSKLNRIAKKENKEYNFIFVKSNGEQLQEIADLFEKLKIKPSIDTIYEFKDMMNCKKYCDT